MKRKFQVCGRIVLFAFLLFTGAEQIWAQPAMRYSRANSGLVDNFVNQVSDFNGVLAVCTQNGLTLVYPDHFESWRRGENGFPDAEVTAATVFAGRLWVGTQGRGVARLDDGRWKIFTQSGSGLIDDFISAVFPLGNRLYIGTREGLCRFDGLLCERVTLSGEAFRGSSRGSSLQVNALAGDASTIFAGTDAGVFRVITDGSASQVSLGIQPEPWIDSVAVYRGTVYAAGEFGLVGVGGDGIRQVWSKDRFPSNRFYTLVPSAEGILCATARGLMQAKADGGVSAIQVGDNGFGKVFPVTSLVQSGGVFWLGFAGGGVARQASLTGSSGIAVEGESSAAGAGSSPLSDVVVFLPPQGNGGAVAQAAGAATSTAVVTAIAAVTSATAVSTASSTARVEKGSRVRPLLTISKKPPKPMNIKFYQDLLPVMVKECHGCHTTGSGRGFPLNDPLILISYFKKAGFDRFAQACEEGRGMAEKVDPKTYQLLQIWVKEGCKE